jgi:hypothetical protein
MFAPASERDVPGGNTHAQNSASVSRCWGVIFFNRQAAAGMNLWLSFVQHGNSKLCCRSICTGQLRTRIGQNLADVLQVYTAGACSLTRFR